MAIQTPHKKVSKETIPFKTQSSVPNRKSNTSIILGSILFVCLVVFASSKFWERFKNDPNLDSAEVEATQKEAEEIAKKHENWIQYVLIATSTKKRPCLRCPNGLKEVTVKIGEIYKYGITTQGEKRYKQKLYQTLEVTIKEEIEGDYTTCKTAEINKILAYRFLPESVKSEVKLTRPPGNANRN